MKKLLSALLATVLAASLFTACGGNTSSAAPETTAPAPESTAAPEVDPEEPGEEGGGDGLTGELNLAIFEGGYGPDYWNEVVALFEAANPDVTVNLQISPDIGDIIRPQIVAGNMPDFISMNDNDQTGVIASMIKEKTLMDVTDVFDGPGINGTGTLRDDIVDGVLETAKVAPYGDGKIYLAPFNISPMGLVYNTTLFEENSWDVPVTWDDFFALGDAAAEQGMSLFTYQGIYPGYLESLIFPAIASAVGLDGFAKITSYEEGSWNNPEVIAVLENLQKISTGGYLMPGTVALNHTQSQTQMMMNDALFITNGNWMEGEMEEAPRADGFEFGLTPAPVMKAGDTRYVMTSVEQFSIPAQAQNPENAKAFLRFLYSDESVKLFAQYSGGIYALKGADELVKGIVTDGVYSMQGVYDEGVSMVVGFEAVPQGSKVNVNDEIFNPITDVMNGSLSVQQWVEDIETAYAEIRADIAAEG